MEERVSHPSGSNLDNLFSMNRPLKEEELVMGGLCAWVEGKEWDLGAIGEDEDAPA